MRRSERAFNQEKFYTPSNLYYSDFIIGCENVKYTPYT